MTDRLPTRMFCSICGRLHAIDFHVPDEIWKEAIHPKFQLSPVCLNCFIQRADEHSCKWDDGIKFMPCSMVTQKEIQQSICDQLNGKLEVTDEEIREKWLVTHGVGEIDTIIRVVRWALARTSDKGNVGIGLGNSFEVDAGDNGRRFKA